MKNQLYRIISLSVVLFVLGLIPTLANAQGDTTWVSTYTWEAQNNPETNYDSPGRRWFDFPASDNGEEYRKVLMYHKLKCFDQGTAGGLGYACGEWDYLSYNYLFDHTGLLDSANLTHPLYRINNLDFETDSLVFMPSEGAPFDTVLTEYSRTVLSEVGVTTTSVLNDAASTDLFMSSAEGKRIEMVWSAEELIEMGVETDVSIRRISLPVGMIEADLLTLECRWSDSEWMTVYEFPASASGMLIMDLSEALVFDGISDLSVSMSFEGLVGDVCDAVASPGNVVLYNATGGYIGFDGGDKMEVAVDSLSEISSEVTLECWLNGDSDWLPANTTIFEAVNSNNQREVNVHMPWSNSRIYWDAGYDGGYDRIDKLSSEDEFEGSWSHWAFTKNAETGIMRIYRNGAVWHEGIDMDNAFGDISEMFLGAAFNGNNSYRGGVDDFRIWRVELTASEISDWMYFSDVQNHPQLSNLAAIFNFNGVNGAFEDAENDSPYGGYCFGNAGKMKYRAKDLFLNPEVPGGDTGSLKPALQFTQGDEDAFESTTEFFTHTYAQPIPPVSVSTWGVAGNDVEWLDLAYGWPHDLLQVTYNALGDTLATYAIEGESVVYTNVELNYFGVPFEVIDRVELGRYITPYGINLSLGNDGWTWIYDVTDYLPLLRDSVELECGNWQELLDLKFAFIEGTPPRDVINVEAFWNGTYYLNSWNDNVQSHQHTVAPNEEMFRLVTRASGHGFGQGNNCGEFCYNTHSVLVDSTSHWSWEIMQECADNPLYPQGGTWIYDRAAWCPGAPVTTQHFELTPWVVGQSTFEVEYDVTDDPFGNYRMEGQIISYSAPNMSHDVELMDILSPNDRKVLSRWNPVCENPVVLIRNNGSEPLEQCIFTYGVSGEEPQTYLYTPDVPLQFLESVQVSLPYDDAAYTVGDDEYLMAFQVSVDLVLEADQEPSNGTAQTSFRRPPTWAYNDLDDNRIIVWTKTNNAPYETTVELTDRDQNVIWERGYTEANTIYRDTIELNSGCYRFTVLDYGDDGLSFWANSDGSGYVRFKKVAGGNFATLEDDFGKSISQAFRFETNLISDVEDVVPVFEPAEVTVFPNPAQGSVRARLEGFDSEVEWVLRNAMAKELQSGTFRPSNGMLLSFDMSDYAVGMYSLEVYDRESRIISWVIRE